MNGYTDATMMVVLDTCVLVSAARSRNGASFALLSSLPNPRFGIALSMTLYTEWRSVLTRAENLPPGMSTDGALAYLSHLAAGAHLQDVYYLWRPFLHDPDDDMVLECAIASGSRYIVTHNVRDFRRTMALGVQAITPSDFLKLIEEKMP